MTTQEAYETIRANFDRSHAKLAKDDVSLECQYRTSDGAKCAIGTLIPDGLYTQEMEGQNADSLLRNNPVVRGYLYGVEFKFLEEAQRLHDVKATTPRDFVAMLDLLARVHGLDAPTSSW